MCGILGYISKKHIDVTWFKESLDTLSSRGPDSFGIHESKYKDYQIILGHRRLSILDTSLAGNQPMKDMGGSKYLVFNGEIYNFLELKKELNSYRYSSKTDSEVILSAYHFWNTKLVSHIEGMFAFAVYDDNEKTLFCARDHFGKKPFYYYLDADTFAFSSEIKALLALPSLKNKLTLDKNAVLEYFMYGYIPSPASIYCEIRKLEPATAFTFDLNTWQIKNKKCYWNLEKIKLSDISFEEAVEETDILLKAAVKKRLIADVPLGSFLSGGVDSGLITAIAAGYESGIETFSVVYENDPKIDESSYVKALGKTLDIKYNFFNFDNELVLPLFIEVLDYIDEPMADAAIIPATFVAKHTSNKVKTVLSGDGGDEVFGGYPKYNAQLVAELSSKWQLQKLTGILKNVLECLPVNKLNNYIKLLDNLKKPLYARQFIWGSGGFSDNELRQLLIEKPYDLNSVFAISQNYTNQFIHQNDIGNLILYLDAKILLPDWYMVKADRASMSQSLELRSPMLDKALAEFAWSLPSKYKFTTLKNKIVLKKLAEKYMPYNIIYRKKQGYGVPLARWLRGELQDIAKELLFKLPPEIVNKEFVVKLWDEFMHQNAEHSTKIWRLIILSSFFKRA